MKVNLKGCIGLAAAWFVVFASLALAQWPSDPATNMAMTTTSGEATDPHIVVTSDGGCYVSWWDNTSGHYSMYMQRLNANGDIMWAPDGLLISNHAQNSWLTDYTLNVDNTDCAILAVNDIRAGGDWDIYAYRINQSGEFLWGPDGLTISNDAYEDAFPQVLITSGGNIVFAWSDITAAGVIRMRKVDINGIDLWTPSIKVISSLYGVGYPRLAETNDDGLILQLLVHQGSQYYNPWHIYARKYDASGTSLWGANGVLINNAASVQIYMAPDIIPDTSGGAFSFWFDARTDNHVYAQHVLSGGTVAWTPNGVVASTAAGQMQVSPHAFYEPATNELIVFYLNKNIDQTIWGVYGQKYNSAGVRQWTDNALALVPLSNQERRYTLVNKIDGGSVVTYFEKPAGDPVNEFVKAIRIDGAGTPVWAEPIVTMCSAMGGKDKLVTCINPFGQIIDAWKDFRSDTDGDIFLQNVNSDGTLGPFDIPRGYIAGLVTGPDGLTPLANVIVTTHNNDDLLAGVDTSSVDGTYGLELAPGTYHQMFELTGYADTTVTDIILAADDTTQVTVNLRGAPTCQYVVGDINSNGVRNGLDVVYGVAYFKGGPVPPYACECTPGNIWYVSGDANASCSFNGLDISFLVSYFKGGPEPQPCLDCPPAR